MVEKPESGQKIKCYQPILQLLLDDGFVTPILLEMCAILLNSRRLQLGSRIIHSFGQLFHITFETFDFWFWALSMNQLQYKYYRGFYFYKIGGFRLYSGEYTRVA
jgi:hypothetical protein